MTNRSQQRADAAAALQRNDWRGAYALALPLCEAAPDDARAHFLLGSACLGLGNMTPALEAFARAWELDSTAVETAVQYAKALSIAEQTNRAITVATRAAALQPDAAMDWDTLGVVFTRSQCYTQAKIAFREAIRRAQGHAPHRYNLASTLIVLGDTVTAETALRECLALDPRHWPAHWALARLGDKDHAAAHIEQLERLLSATRGNPQAEVPAEVALSREYETQGDYAQAFAHLTTGKHVGKRATGYNIARDEAVFDALMQAFAKPPSHIQGDASNEPIFILGMPRTGTTLVERIVSSHPDVSTIGEIRNFPMMMKHLSGARTPRLLDPQTVAALAARDWANLGRVYIDSTRPRTGRTPHFIDKLPHNFLNLGFIAQSLPNAPIICMRRHPMDTCLGNFRQLFALGSPFCDYTFDLLDIGRYYVLFDRLMAHWHQLFPGRVLEVHYEALVDDQEMVTREILAHCGLAWDARCLAFEHNAAPVGSASATQVRTGIHRRALARWRHYQPWLGELRQLLEGNGIKVAE